MGFLDKLLGKGQTKKPSDQQGRKARPLGLAPLSREEAKIQEMLAAEKKRAAATGSGSIKAAEPTKRESPRPMAAEPEASEIDIQMVSLPTSPPVSPEGVAGSFEIQRQLRDIQTNLLNLDDNELDERLNQIIEKLQAFSSPGGANGEQLHEEDRSDLYDLMITTLSIAKFPKSRASLRPLLEMDLKSTISRTQGKVGPKVLAQLNCRNILEISRLRELQRFYDTHPSLGEIEAVEKAWEYQLTSTQFAFARKVFETYPSLRRNPEIFQVMSDAQIQYLAANVLGLPEHEFRATLAKMRILRERRSQESQFQKVFLDQYREFLDRIPKQLREKLERLDTGEFAKWVRSVSTTIVEYVDQQAAASGVTDRAALEKDRWTVSQLVEKGMFHAVLETIEKFKNRAEQPRELAFEIQKRNTRYFSKHPPFWVAIVEVIARDRDRILIDGNLTGEGPLGGVPVQRERMNVSERLKESLRGREYASVPDREIAEKVERAVQLLGRKLAQTGSFLSMFHEALQTLRQPGPDELEYFPHSIRSIQTDGLEDENTRLAQEGKELRPTEEEIVSTLNNLEPILEFYPVLRDKGGLEVFIYQKYLAMKKEPGSAEDMQTRRRELAERLNIVINQVLMPWIKRCRDNLESSLSGAEG